MRTSVTDVVRLLKKLAEQEHAFHLTFSGVEKGQETPCLRLNLRPFLADKVLCWTATCTSETGEYHETVKASRLLDEAWLSNQMQIYSRLHIRGHMVNYQLFANRDGSLRILERPGIALPLPGNHDRRKNYLISEGMSLPFLHKLGIMTATGSIIKGRQHKFRQINRFLEMVADVYDSLPQTGTLHVVDFGCGKSLLTFALHWLLTVHYGREVNINGIDMKADIINECNDIQRSLKLKGLQFTQGDITNWETSEQINLTVALHACDTATDAAIARAVGFRSNVIMVAPCCQHELASQLTAEGNQVLLQHGIIRERLGALITDSLRSAALEALGWKSQIIEFIDSEHTAKNLLIRAELPRRPKTIQEMTAVRTAYQNMKSAWSVDRFALESYLSDVDLEMLKLTLN